MHSAEYDYIRRCGRGGLRQPKRISNAIGDLLNFGALIVVRQKNSVAFAAKPPDALLLFSYLLGGVLQRFDRRKDVPGLESIDLDGRSLFQPCHSCPIVRQIDAVLFPELLH